MKPIFLIPCKKCNDLVKDKEQCKCGFVAIKNSKKSNFLVYFLLLPQVRRILHEHFDTVLKYIQREHDSNTITDIDDGLLYQKLKSKNPESRLLTLTMNLDETTIFKSCRSSLWPVQFVANFLPPSIRYLPENMIVSMLFYGSEKPDMNKLLFPIAKELDTNKELMTVLTSENEFLDFRVSILLVSCDLPAKAAVQNFVGKFYRYADTLLWPVRYCCRSDGLGFFASKLIALCDCFLSFFPF